MTSLLDIKADFYARWVAPDGCVKLSLDDEYPPFPGQTLNRVGNENGILYLAYALMWMDHLGILTKDDRNRASQAVARTAVEDHPGYFDRHPGNHVTLNSHDNIIGTAAIGILTNTPIIPLSIVTAGNESGWFFNNIVPSMHIASSLLQGGDVAYLKWCAGQVPPIWEALWYWIGWGISLFTTKAYIKNLRELRSYTMGQTNSPISDGFTEGFQADHPIRLLAEWTRNSKAPSSSQPSVPPVG